MIEIELDDLTDLELQGIIESISKHYTPESKSYISSGTSTEQFEALGRAVFNEYVTDAVKAVATCVRPDGTYTMYGNTSNGVQKCET